MSDDTFTFSADSLPSMGTAKATVLETMPDRVIQVYQNPDGTTRLMFMLKVDLTDDERKALAEEVTQLFDERQFESLSSSPYRVTNWKTSVMGAIARLLEANPLDLVRIYECLRRPPKMHREVKQDG